MFRHPDRSIAPIVAPDRLHSLSLPNDLSTSTAADALCPVYQWIVWSFRRTLTPTYPVGVSGVPTADDGKVKYNEDGNSVGGRREAVCT